MKLIKVLCIGTVVLLAVHSVFALQFDQENSRVRLQLNERQENEIVVPKPFSIRAGWLASYGFHAFKVKVTNNANSPIVIGPWSFSSLHLIDYNAIPWSSKGEYLAMGMIDYALSSAAFLIGMTKYENNRNLRKKAYFDYGGYYYAHPEESNARFVSRLDKRKDGGFWIRGQDLYEENAEGGATRWMRIGKKQNYTWPLVLMGAGILGYLGLFLSVRYALRTITAFLKEAVLQDKITIQPGQTIEKIIFLNTKDYNKKFDVCLHNADDKSDTAAFHVDWRW